MPTTAKQGWESSGTSDVGAGRAESPGPATAGQSAVASAKVIRRVDETLTAPPAVAVLVSTYQRPGHLRRCLTSLAVQRDAAGRFEVVVTDDGSTDETADVVGEFASTVDFPVHFTSHPHAGFRLAQCRNEGVAATQAEYLLFIDGDLIVPPTFVADHLRHRRPGWALAGDSAYLDEATSREIDQQAVARGDCWRCPPGAETRRIRAKARRAKLYVLLRHPRRPSLKGGNIAMWRDDYVRVNGYDQNFVGWGLEETDLQWRLRKAGVRIGSSMSWTHTYHLWHPRHATFAPRSERTANERYMTQPGRLHRCRNGLQHRQLNHLKMSVRGPGIDDPRVKNLVRSLPQAASERPEVEIIVGPGREKFSKKTECRVLVVTDPRLTRLGRGNRPHLLISDHTIDGADSIPQFPLERFDEAIGRIG